MKQAINARERALCQLCVLSFRVEVKEVFQLQVIYSTENNLKVAFAQLCNDLKGCNFTVV